MNEYIKELREFESLGESALNLINEEIGFRSNPIIISDNDIYINWDKWETAKSHLLIITGRKKTSLVLTLVLEGIFPEDIRL